jgi:multiple sugar transport system ATP-binding protein
MSVAENMGSPLRLARHSKAEIARKVGEAARRSSSGLSISTVCLDSFRRPASVAHGSVRSCATRGFPPDLLLFQSDAKLSAPRCVELKEFHARSFGSTTIYVTTTRSGGGDDHTSRRDARRIAEQTAILFDALRPAQNMCSVAGFIGSLTVTSSPAWIPAKAPVFLAEDGLVLAG